MYNKQNVDIIMRAHWIIIVFLISLLISCGKPDTRETNLYYYNSDKFNEFVLQKISKAELKNKNKFYVEINLYDIQNNKIEFYFDYCDYCEKQYLIQNSDRFFVINDKLKIPIIFTFDRFSTNFPGQYLHRIRPPDFEHKYSGLHYYYQTDLDFTYFKLLDYDDGSKI